MGPFDLIPSLFLAKLIGLFTFGALFFLLVSGIGWVFKLLLVSLILAIFHFQHWRSDSDITGFGMNHSGECKVWGQSGKIVEARIQARMLHPYFIWLELTYSKEKPVQLSRFCILFYDQLSERDFKKLRSHFIHFYQ